jgi:hypothetical protein
VDDLKKRRFLWGVVLVWAPWIPIGLGVGGALVIVSGQKATGIGVAAYSLTELFVVCGVGAILIT